MATKLSEEVVKRYRRIEEIIPSNWWDDAVLANGIRHHYYRTGGDKPPLVLLHGFLEGALSWLRTARVLEQDYDVIMIDARGHGRSDGVEIGFSQNLLMEDAAGVIRSLKLGKPRLMGFSMGGGTAVNVAGAYPDLVHSLIVEGWADAADMKKMDFKSEGYMAWYNTYLSWLEELKTQTHEERMISALSQLMPEAPVWPEDDYVAWVEDCANLNLDLVRSSINMWSEAGEEANETVQPLQRVICPALIMKSGSFPTPGAEQYVQEEASEQPNIRIVRFVNTGHLIRRDQFDDFINLVRPFLRQE